MVDEAIYAMSPAEATARLAEMSASINPAPSPAPAAATPTVPASSSSAEASARLAELNLDQAFRERVLNGDAAATKQFKELIKSVAAGGDDVEIAMSGVLPDVPSSELRMMASAAEMLRDKGFSQRAIRETLDDKPATPADIDLATQLKSQHTSSAEFTKQFLAGEPDAVLRMLAVNAILSKVK